MSVPQNLGYTKTHEWILKEGGKAKVGITDHAQEQMGDLVYVELPEVGDILNAGENFAVVESVKATSDVEAPVSGRVAAVNEALADEPGQVNEDCYAAWFVELDEISEDEPLMSAAEYEDFLISEG